MAKITNLSQFKSYILSQLGAPIITIELADEQLDNIAYDSIQDFQRYNYTDGSYKDYMMVELSGGVMYYDLSGTNVEACVDMILSTGNQGNINVLFTPVNMLLGGNPMIMNMGNFSMGEYYSGMMMLREIMNTFAVTYKVSYNATQERLTVTPTPTERMRGLLEVYKREVSENLYNHTLVKKLAVARAKVLWGRIIGKFNITIPGGGTFSGQEIRAEGEEEEKEIMADIRAESSPPDFQMG